MVITLTIAAIITLFYVVLVCGKNKERSGINEVFDNMNKTMKPEEKLDVVQKLFVESAKQVQAFFPGQDYVKTTIFTAELALHIFALWLANEFKDLKVDGQKEFIESLGFNAYIISIKEFLNRITRDALKQNTLDNKTVTAMIIVRTAQILKDSDIEERNLHFLNLCYHSIKYETDTVFVVQKISDLPILPGNPLDIIFLPGIYKCGMVDKYMQELDKAL